MRIVSYESNEGNRFLGMGKIEEKGFELRKNLIYLRNLNEIILIVDYWVGSRGEIRVLGKG